jgi:hypothetical protein
VSFTLLEQQSQLLQTVHTPLDNSQTVRGPISCPQLQCFDVAFDSMQLFLSDDVA